VTLCKEQKKKPPQKRSQRCLGQRRKKNSSKEKKLAASVCVCVKELVPATNKGREGKEEHLLGNGEKRRRRN